MAKKPRMNRVKMLTAMAGQSFSYSAGDVVSMAWDEAKSLVESGQAVDVNTDDEKMKELALNSGHVLFARENTDIAALEEFVNSLGYSMAPFE